MNSLVLRNELTNVSEHHLITVGPKSTSSFYCKSFQKLNGVVTFLDVVFKRQTQSMIKLPYNYNLSYYKTNLRIKRRSDHSRSVSSYGSKRKFYTVSDELFHTAVSYEDDKTLREEQPWIFTTKEEAIESANRIDQEHYCEEDIDFIYIEDNIRYARIEETEKERGWFVKQIKNIFDIKEAKVQVDNHNFILDREFFKAKIWEFKYGDEEHYSLKVNYESIRKIKLKGI